MLNGYRAAVNTARVGPEIASSNVSA